MGYCPATWRGSDRGKCGPSERGVWKGGSRQMEPCNRRRVGVPAAPQTIEGLGANIQSMFWPGRWEPQSSLAFQLRGPKAGPAAVLQAGPGLVSRRRDRAERCGWRGLKTNTYHTPRGEGEKGFLNAQREQNYSCCAFTQQTLTRSPFLG